ncbi:MAG TPA: HAD-IIA family hydrolase [Kiritimatiellia bacterium]|jgi:NagD protein|nr:HAD-IIA family hydrolase [Kiritimatiellia bacterium]HOR98250.1 HAD-IIA family hydrolase [Kiritimatiellia bacterium]HPK38232.1 HAD-IIA family hydrolase [Kiritimatiellia bacterium]HPW75608.1 HAD-IIA family hydrolase [Kiritimatiellia bacterium]
MTYTPSASPSNVRGIICDMDGVIYHGNALLPGTRPFIDWLRQSKTPFLFLTNSSERSPRELSEKLSRLGVLIEESHFYTSAMATAAFLASQTPGGSAYVIGQPGLIHALYEAGFSINDVNPDYVVVGETPMYTYETIKKSVSLVRNGAKLIGTNPDLTGPVEHGIIPACGALVAPIELATGMKAYFVGKPNPLMMRSALRLLGCPRESALIVGDRMDTDILSGIEAGMQTVLVLSGVTRREDLVRYSYRPNHVLDHVGLLPDLLGG